MAAAWQISYTVIRSRHHVESPENRWQGRYLGRFKLDVED